MLDHIWSIQRPHSAKCTLKTFGAVRLLSDPTSQRLTYIGSHFRLLRTIAA